MSDYFYTRGFRFGFILGATLMASIMVASALIWLFLNTQ